MDGSATRPRVKAIAWQVGFSNGEYTHYADTLLGRYATWERDGKGICARFDGTRETHPSLEAAKAAAQADFDARILGVIDLG